MSEPQGEVKLVRLVKFRPEEKRNFVPNVIEIVRRPPDWEDPSLLTKAQRLSRELARWAKAGLPMASRAVRKARLATCRACQYFDPSGNLGLGQCRAPGCGCTKVKAALQTSRCPMGKWAT